MEGSTLAERYLIEECVGEGAMGRVYRAQHVRMSRRFAIKILLGDFALDRAGQTRFANEAEAACRLDHANVVSVMDFGETDEGLLYLVMPFIEGANLATLLDAEMPLEPKRAINLIGQIARGLQHAHEHNFVHRDLKPENIIVVTEHDAEIPKIIDFGLAIEPDSDRSGPRLTAQGVSIGTPAYMSPEQACGKPIDHRTDLFSLGVMFYEMLAGQLPFDGTSIELARQNVLAKPPRITERSPQVFLDEELENIVLRLIAKKPAQRYQSAGDLVTALDNYSQGRPSVDIVPVVVEEVSSQPSREIEEIFIPPPKSGRLRWLIPLALGALVVVAGLGLFFMDSRGAEEASKATAKAPTAAETSSGAVESNEPAPEPDQPAPESGESAKSQEVAEVAEADAGVEAPPETRRRKRNKRNKDREPREVGVDDLTKKYRAVGAAVERLESKHGAKAAEPYRQRYFGIPFSDALRKQGLRGEVMSKLKKLHRDVRRANRKRK